MTFPTSRQVDSAERIAETIDMMCSGMLDQLQSWRARVSGANTLSSIEVQEAMQVLASVRTYVTSKTAVPGLVEAYKRRFTGLNGFVIATEWGTASTAMQSLYTWLRDNWPNKLGTGPGFQMAYLQLNATTGIHESYTVPLSGPNRTTLLSRIDAVLTAFAQV